jgi:hypothetical protein
MDELLNHPDINIQYINKINKSLMREAQMASNIANISIEEHIRTSCYFTALLIRWLISDYEWVKVSEEYIHDKDIYQIVIGENEIDDQHYLTVFNKNVVFQSFWKEYSLKEKMFPNLDTLLKSCDWFKLTGVDILNTQNYKCFYYVPIHKYNEMEFLRKLYSII